MWESTIKSRSYNIDQDLPKSSKATKGTPNINLQTSLAETTTRRQTPKRRGWQCHAAWRFH